MEKSNMESIRKTSSYVIILKIAERKKLKITSCDSV